jgi:anti-sigma B factor antagonist
LRKTVMNWPGGPAPAAVAVVTLPAEIDISNSARARDELIRAVQDGVLAVIADMTDTIFCDSSAVAALIRAHRAVAAAGAELRLAVASDRVLRVFSLTGADEVLSIYPSRDDATQAAMAGSDPDS